MTYEQLRWLILPGDGKLWFTFFFLKRLPLLWFGVVYFTSLNPFMAWISAADHIRQLSFHFVFRNHKMFWIHFFVIFTSHWVGARATYRLQHLEFAVLLSRCLNFRWSLWTSRSLEQKINSLLIPISLEIDDNYLSVNFFQLRWTKKHLLQFLNFRLHSLNVAGKQKRVCDSWNVFSRERREWK